MKRLEGNRDEPSPYLTVAATPWLRWQFRLAWHPSASKSPTPDSGRQFTVIRNQNNKPARSLRRERSGRLAID